MQFIEPTIEAITSKLNSLKEDTQPLWGQMSATRMVEHLADAIRLSFDNHDFKQTIPEEHVPSAQKFLSSDKKLPREFQVQFATPEMKERNSNIQEAIEDLKDAWQEFEEFYRNNPDATNLHPSFGYLGYKKWLELHSKHFTHHLEQFGIHG